jgi:hypothetical protein
MESTNSFRCPEFSSYTGSWKKLQLGTTIEIHPKFTENPKIMSRKKETRHLESRP